VEKAGAPDAPPGPSLQAVPFLKIAAETETVVLTPRQREKLMLIGTRLRLPARTIIYREGAAADSVYAIGEGAVKSYREFPSGKRSVCAFLFQRDLFGLAERGQYINCTQAITRVTVYRLPVSQLMLLLKRDGDLQFQFLTKVTHELRESQRRAVLIHRRDAVGRLAMFIELMAERNGRVTARTQRVPLPMSRTDMAGYLGLSLESVSRAARELVRRKLVKFETPHLARIVDAAGLADVAAAG
jgi:CRP/FNR family transcriptional regulator, anaerobic regulatory protein